MFALHLRAATTIQALRPSRRQWHAGALVYNGVCRASSLSAGLSTKDSPWPSLALPPFPRPSSRLQPMVRHSFADTPAGAPVDVCVMRYWRIDGVALPPGTCYLHANSKSKSLGLLLRARRLLAALHPQIMKSLLSLERGTHPQLEKTKRHIPICNQAPGFIDGVSCAIIHSTEPATQGNKGTKATRSGVATPQRSTITQRGKWVVVRNNSQTI